MCAACGLLTDVVSLEASHAQATLPGLRHDESDRRPQSLSRCQCAPWKTACMRWTSVALLILSAVGRISRVFLPWSSDVFYCCITFLRGRVAFFGNFTMLTFVFGCSLRGRRVITQDPASEEAMDVSDRARMNGRSLQLAEADLGAFGLHAATVGDISSPAMVLALR